MQGECEIAQTSDVVHTLQTEVIKMLLELRNEKRINSA